MDAQDQIVGNLLRCGSDTTGTSEASHGTPITCNDAGDLAGIRALAMSGILAVPNVASGSVSVDITNAQLLTASEIALNWDDRRLFATDGTDVILSWSTAGLADFNDSEIRTTGQVTAANEVLSGTSKQANITQVISGSKVLTDNTATGFAEIAIGVGECVGGVIAYTIKVANGTDLQCHSGGVGFAAVNKAETVTNDIKENYSPSTEIEVVTVGTLTDAFTCSNTYGAPGKITLNADVNSSLTSVITLDYTLTLHSMNAVTKL